MAVEYCTRLKTLYSLLVLFILVTALQASSSETGDVEQLSDNQVSEIGVSREETRSPVKHGNTSDHEGGHRYHVAKFDFEYVKTYLIVAIWVLYAGAAKIFFHRATFLSNIFPESCMLIVVGVLLGLALYFDKNTNYELNPTTFFLILLPPIILDAGYFMPTRPFFDQLGTILLYAVFGTLLNTLMLGFTLWGVYEGGGFSDLDSPLLMLHSLVFASLLAAVDPVAVIAVFDAIQVNDILYIVVFGESLLNDGISVVLYHVFEGFSEIGLENIQGIDILAGFASFFVIVFGAVGVGIVMGLFGGFLSRFTHHVRIMEPLMVFVIGYLSFIVAEMFHLSGILSCTFCGIIMRKYVEANISPKSKTTIKYLIKIAASTCEIIIFMYLGISAVSDTHHWDTAFCILTVVFCLVFRAIGVIVLTYLANLIRVVKLTKIDQFVMAYGGLRGAIAFALVILLDKDLFPQRRMFITTTILVIYFTNLVMGTTIKPLVQLLKVKRADKRKPSMTEKVTCRFMDHIMVGIEDVSDQKGHHFLRERFSYFNNKYLKPIIVGRENPQRQGWQIWSVYNRLNDKSAQQIIRSANSSTSLSVLFRNAFESEMSRSSSVTQLFATTTGMSRSLSGVSENWQWGNTGAMSNADSFTSLDPQLLETKNSRKTKDKGQHGSENTNRSIKDKRSATREGQQPATGQRLYAARRPPEYEPKADLALSSIRDAETDHHLSAAEAFHSMNDESSGAITFTTRTKECTDNIELNSLASGNRQLVGVEHSPSSAYRQSPSVTITLDNDDEGNTRKGVSNQGYNSASDNEDDNDEDFHRL